MGDAPQFDENMAGVLARAVVPQYIQTFLLQRKLVSTELFANCLPDISKVDDLILKPAGFDDPNTASADDMLATRGQVCHAWNMARKLYEESEKSRSEDANAVPNSLSHDKRLQIFSEYQKRYSCTIPLEDTPSDRTLGTIFQLWKKRSCEPVPFPLVLSVRDAEVSLSQAGYVPVAGTGMFIQNVQQRKNSNWMKSSQWYVHTVRLLLNSYVLVSCLDPEGGEWLHADVAANYLAKLQRHERINSISENNLWTEIVDAETTLRQLWHEKATADPTLNLTDVITLSLEAARYPEESRYVARTRKQWIAPSTPSKSSYCPKASSPIAPQDRSNEWQTGDRKRQRTERGSKGSRLMKNEQCHRYQRGSCPHGEGCHYTHTQEEAQLVDDMNKFNVRPSASDLRSGKVPEQLKKLRDQSSSARQP